MTDTVTMSSDQEDGTDRAIAAIEAPIRTARADEARFRHLAMLPVIADEDVTQLNAKEREYGASWKKRGGVGAFMMLARKWDRLENMVDELKSYPDLAGEQYVAGPYDVFSHIHGSSLQESGAESLLDTIGDLRRYLMLVEAEMRSRLQEETARRIHYHEHDTSALLLDTPAA